MSNIVFGGPKALHKHLLKFVARSPKTVTYDGDEYTIQHTQYAQYDLQDAFETVVAETDADPRHDDDFSDQAEDAIAKADACLDDDLHYHYQKREYIDAHDFWSAADDYHLMHLNLEDGYPNTRCANPRAETREEAIAEVFSLMNADEAKTGPFLPFVGGITHTDDDDDEKPNEGVDPDEVAYALRDTALMLHGPSAFRRPDPSLHVTQALYEIYDEIGMEKNVRNIYGILVNPIRPDYYRPDNAAKRVVMREFSAGLAGRDDTKKWTSNNEPPLETLDSYDSPE